MEGQAKKGADNGEEEGSDFLRQRAEWFYGRRAYPRDTIPPRARLDALEQMDRMIEQERKLGLLPPENFPAIGFPGPNPAWGSIGPRPENNTFGNLFFGLPSNSGRVAAIAVDPTNQDTVYVGGAQGGIWKSTDAGATFTPVTDDQVSLATGSIAIAPSNTSIIFVGTGEQDFTGGKHPQIGDETYWGAGVLKSTDGGATWAQMGAATFAGPLSNNVGGARIPAIAVHPTNPLIVLAGVSFTNTTLADAGIYRSADGGATWTAIATAGGAIGTGIAWNPADGTTVYAALGSGGGDTSNGVYKSTDAGLTFTKLAGGLPTANIGRIELAIAKSLPSTLYASIASASSGSGSLLGMWKSTDSGATWTQKVDGTTFDYCGGQCFYSHAIAVSPTDPNTIWAGGTAGFGAGTTIGQNLFRSTDGGTTFTAIFTGASGSRLHADLHAIAFAASGTRAYVGNDGGAWRTDNATASAATLDWTGLNGTLTLAQAYPGMSVDQSNINTAYIGTQDNGVIRFSGNAAWDMVACGDGAATLTDPQVPSTAYVMCTSGNSPYIQKSVVGGTANTFTRIETGINLAEPREFIPYITMDPSNNNILYTPTSRVYQSINGGITWGVGSPILSGARIPVITVAKSDSNSVYAATDAARIWRTTNALSGGAAATWTDITTVDLPARFITQIAVDRTNRDIVYLTYNGFTFPPGDTKGHVFKTINGGAAWTDISGNLPNIPVNDIILDPDASFIYIATDIGVFQSADGGATWTTLGTGLPRVAVLSLNGSRHARMLFAGTHGRGVWVLQLTNVAIPAGPLLVSISPSFKAAGAATFALAADGANFTATSKVQWDGSQTGVSTAFVSANRLTATIDTSLLIAGVHDVTVFDSTQLPTTSDNIRFAVTGPPPSITSLSPPVVGQGSSAFNLQINGTNFVCSATPGVSSFVLFNGVQKDPTACSATQLTTGILASEVATSGGRPVIVHNRPPGGGPSNTLTLTVGTPPPNDDVLNAINTTPSPFSDTEDTSGATTDTGGRVDPTPTNVPGVNDCTTGAGRTNTIWYKFTPTTSGTIVADTQPSNFDTLLSVWTGTPGAFTTQIACNDDFFGLGGSSQVTFNGVAGTTYFFMIGGFFGDFGTSVFRLTAPAPTGPVVSFNPASVTFPSTNVGSQSAITNVVITNSGTATLNVTGFTLTGTNPADFALATATSGTPCTPTPSLAAAASCSQGVRFTPGTAGLRAANLSVASNASGSPQVLPMNGLAGSASAPAVTFNPINVNFGTVTIGQQSAITNVQLTNSGTATLNFTGGGNAAITLTGADAAQFALAAPTSGTDCRTIATLAAAASCNIGSRFAPTTEGVKNANISVADDASGSPQTVPLSGTGQGTPAVTFNPINVPFGSQLVGTQSAVTNVQLSNTGNGTLTFTGGGNAAITLTGADAGQYLLAAPTAGTDCRTLASVAPGANCNMGVRFAPTTLGLKNASISVADNAAASPQSVPLTGTGTQPAITFLPTSVPFGNVALGSQSAVTNIQVSNSGTATLNITTITLTGTNPTEFALVAPISGASPECPVGASQVTSGNSCFKGVRFQPTVLGARSANFSLADDAAGSPQTVALTGSGVQAQVVLSPSPLGFGNQRVGTTSGVQIIGVTNSGNAAVLLAGANAVTITGANGGDFSADVATTTCTNGLALTAAPGPGNTCNIGLKFGPTATGARAGTVNLADNAPGSPQTAGLTGTGTQPAVTLNPTNVPFGSVQAGQQSPVTNVQVTNSGTATLTFTGGGAVAITLTGANAADFGLAAPTAGTDCRTLASLAAAVSCNIGSRFAPLLANPAGAKNANVSIADDAPNTPQTVPLTGTSVITPVVSLSTNALNFGSRRVATTSAPMTVTLTNTGNATLNIATVVIGGTNGANFAFAAGTTCTNGSAVLAGANCVANLTFTPDVTGARSGSLTFTDDATTIAPVSPQVVSLSGTGIAPAVTLNPTTVPFGNQNITTQSAVTNVQVTNSGTDTLNFTGGGAAAFTLTGTNPGEFALAAPTAGTDCRTIATLAPAASCNVGGRFAPTTTGAKSANIRIADDASGSPQLVPLTGTGTQPGVQLSVNAFAFGNVNVGDTKSAAPAITLTNNGTGPLTITGITLSGANAAEFGQGNTCPASPATLAAAANCTITPTLHPTTTGAKNASVNIADNAPTTPQAITLTGTGVDFAVAPTGPTTQTIPAGGAATYTINVTGGPLANAVNLTASGMPAATTASFNPASFVAGTNGGSSTLTLTTTARTAQMGATAPPSEAPPINNGLWLLALAFALAGIIVLRHGIRTRRLAYHLPFALLLLSVALIAGCSSPGGPKGTPIGTSTVTVTATSGGVTHTTTVTLTVQ
jgi:hypothetical protein